jgi:type VI secretion system secreted protein VgrG
MDQIQEARPVAITTPLGDDVLLFNRMTATEELGRLFRFDLDLLSKEPDIKFNDILGQNITIRLRLPEAKKRYFNGYVSHFSQQGMVDEFHAYKMTVNPWLWFLTRSADCRIFQEKSVPDIIKEVFRDHGFTDFEETLSGNYRTWNYCVQYRETDFNFVSRLMEQEGIYYFFKHQKDKHVLVLSDSISAHAPYPDYEKLPFFPPDEHLRRVRDHIFDWTLERKIQPGVYALNEYDFTRPKATMQVKSSIQRNHAHTSLEIFDYPGEYPDTSDGENYVRARIEELHVEHEQVHGQGNARGLAAGSLFELTDYPREDQNQEYLIISATHQIASEAYTSGNAEGTGQDYTCIFTALHSKQSFRPARTTPKPKVHGPQTAVVVGPSGDEIHTDKYGRVKIQFHWDRYGKLDENSSCWVRVSHPTAGKGWGAVQIPRIGQEVIVDFLEGDPDQPIIMGRVYNANQMPPYELPGSGMVSGMKSNSTPGGGGYNEISMDDTKDKEQMTLHAQYNQSNTVENDQSVTVVSGNRVVSVQSGTQSETIKGDANLTVQAGSRSVNVTGGDYNALSTTAAATIKGHTSVSITGVSAGTKLDGTGGPGVQITGVGSTGVSIKGTANIEANADVVAAFKGGTKVDIEAPHVQIGNATIMIKGSSIVLDGGGGKIMIDGSGVTIMGPKIDSVASGPHTVAGAIVKIN